jgi:molecular chaperone HtpG
MIYQKGKKYQAGRDIKYWTCFVPNRGVWEKLSANKGLTRNDLEEDEGQYKDETFSGYFFSGGLYTSSKGMPTGIYVDIKPSTPSHS